MDVRDLFTAAPPAIEGYQLAPLTPDHGALVERLCERCADVSEQLMGVPPGPAEAQSLYIQLPEGKGYEDKLLVGVFAGPEDLVGVLDAIRDEPVPGMWWLGVLMLDPAHRNQGLGARVYYAFEAWAQRSGVRAIQLTVAEQNEAAYRFWQRLGFVERERRGPRCFGARARVFVVMRRELDAQSEP